MNAARIVTAAALVLASIAGARAAGLADAPPGATSCSGCHATSGAVDAAVPPLAGRNAGELAAAMEAFKTGQRPSTVMDRIAKGFADAEIKAIAAWYGAQKN